MLIKLVVSSIWLLDVMSVSRLTTPFGSKPILTFWEKRGVWWVFGAKNQTNQRVDCMDKKHGGASVA